MSQVGVWTWCNHPTVRNSLKAVVQYYETSFKFRTDFDKIKATIIDNGYQEVVKSPHKHIKEPYVSDIKKIIKFR